MDDTLMQLTARPNTIPAVAATVGVCQLLAVAYVWLFGFDPSPISVWGGICLAFAIPAVLGRFIPDWARGVAIGAAYYAGEQALYGLLFTPSPPTVGEHVLGATIGVALVVVAVLLKRQVDAGVRAAKLDHEAAAE